MLAEVLVKAILLRTKDYIFSLEPKIKCQSKLKSDKKINKANRL